MLSRLCCPSRVRPHRRAEARRGDTESGCYKVGLTKCGFSVVKIGMSGKLLRKSALLVGVFDVSVLRFGGL